MRYETLIFVGPSLYGVKIAPRLDELWLPPAAQGDILKSVIRWNPRQIVLIDGTFRQTLAVWVKEIVFAMVDGVKFIGAASMGALRAAELSRYGAIGIGSIYDSYRTGKIEDDSWVAMTYDPDTFKPLTEPPCGMDQKRLDAVAAIEYARTNKESVKTTLTKEAVAPLLTAVFDRILDNEMLIYGGR
jgi:hypothetical protein